MSWMLLSASVPKLSVCIKLAACYGSHSLTASQHHDFAWHTLFLYLGCHRLCGWWAFDQYPCVLYVDPLEYLDLDVLPEYVGLDL